MQAGQTRYPPTPGAAALRAAIAEKAGVAAAKLHIGLDPDSADSVTSSLTAQDVGDPAALPDLLSQIDAPVTKFIADGAYDGKPTHDVLVTQFGPEIEIIIPPPVTAVMGSYAVRDAHLAAIRAKGRTAWQEDTGSQHQIARRGTNHRNHHRDQSLQPHDQPLSCGL